MAMFLYPLLQSHTHARDHTEYQHMEGWEVWICGAQDLEKAAMLDEISLHFTGEIDL